MPYIEFRCSPPRQEAPGLNSKYLRLATLVPWDLGSRQIHEDFGIPFIAEHIIALNASFESKLADIGYPYFGNSAYT
jgi:hypothetical protein